MDRLTLVITLLTGAFLTVGLLVASFSTGYEGWPAVIGAIIIGFGVSWPAAHVMSKRIKRIFADREPPRMK